MHDNDVLKHLPMSFQVLAAFAMQEKHAQERQEVEAHGND